MIQLTDLRRQHDPLRKEIKTAIKKIIDASAFAFGEELERFEKNFARFCDCKYGIGVGNGTEAILLALRALGIGPGDEVISVVNTHTATIHPVIQLGAKPVLVDCDEFFNIDVTKIEEKITPKTRAIIPVHLLGQPVDMQAIMHLAKKYKLKVIEDCAQAHGAKYQGKKVGCLGDAGCFSFYPGKNLGAMGDGGMVVTNSQRLAEKIKSLRFFGFDKDKYRHKVVGYNSRLDNLQAAILNIKLKRLREWNQQRRQAAKLYNRLLAGVVEIPREMTGIEHVYHMYVIKTSRQSKLQEFLHQKGIATGIHYPIPLHFQEAHKNLGYEKGDFPKAEANAKTILSLPIFPGITEDEIKQIAASVREFYAK